MKKYILSSDYKLSVVAVVDGQKSEESSGFENVWKIALRV